MTNRWKVVQDVSCITGKQIANVYNSVGFTVPETFVLREDYMDITYPSGCYGFFVFKDIRLIGVARVMSDDIICSWIAEICVHSDWQSQGVGRAIMAAINFRFAHTAIYLEALNGTEFFFEKFGIKPRPTIVACSKAAEK